MSTPIIDSGAGTLLKTGLSSGQGAVPPVQGGSADDHPDFAQMLAAMDTPKPAAAPPQEEDNQTPAAAPDTSETAEDDAAPLPRLPSQAKPQHTAQGDAPTPPPLGAAVTAPSSPRSEPPVAQPQGLVPRTVAAPASPVPEPATKAQTPVPPARGVPQNHEHRATHPQAPIQAAEVHSRPPPPARVQQTAVPQRAPEPLPLAQAAPVQNLSPVPTMSVASAPPETLPQAATRPMQTPEKAATHSDKQVGVAPDMPLRPLPEAQADMRTSPLQSSADRSPRLETTAPPVPAQTATRQAHPSVPVQRLYSTPQPAAPRAETTSMPVTASKGFGATNTVETPAASVRSVAAPAIPPQVPETPATPARNASVAGQPAALQPMAPRTVPAGPMTQDVPARAIPAPSQEVAALPTPQAAPKRPVNILVKSADAAAPTPTQVEQASAQRPAVTAPKYAAALAPEVAPKTPLAAAPAMPNALPRTDAADISTPPNASRSQPAPAVQWTAEAVAALHNSAVTSTANTSTPVPAAQTPLPAQPTATIPTAAIEVQVRSAPYSIQPDAPRPVRSISAPLQTAEVKPTAVSVTLGTAEVRVPAPPAANTAPAPVTQQPTSVPPQPTPTASLQQPTPPLPLVAEQQTATVAPPLGAEAKAVPIAGASIAAEVSQRKPSKADLHHADTPRRTPDSTVPTNTASFTAQPRTAFATSAPMTVSIPTDHSTKPDTAFSLLAPVDGGDLLYGDPLRAPATTAGPAQPLRADMTPHIARQMVEAMPQAAHRPVEIALSPQELGRVRMSITTEDGAVTVSILAERADTLDLMRRNIEQLGQSFRSMGYDQISFSFGQGMGGGEQNPEGQGNDGQTVSAANTDSDIIETPTPDTASAALRVQTTGIDIRL
ncbi:flagellar hook-length control protein FliK [Sulfitobacter sp. HNIBRBA2951]|uniref:flagellar hook-length control protein FliK n=1 Tax=Sulfitobacter aquimarinus TaxID=3158557 RepID=UPI0032DF12CC